MRLCNRPSETVDQTQKREGSHDNDIFSLLSSGQTLARWARKYAAVNGYGLFARMTKTRYELQFEGSIDGQVWRPYSFRYKPNSPGEMPSFAGVHMPRLDWQLWFSALRPRCSERWFLACRGSPLVRKPLKRCSSSHSMVGSLNMRVKRIPVSFSNLSHSRRTFGSAEPIVLNSVGLECALTTRKP